MRLFDSRLIQLVLAIDDEREGDGRELQQHRRNTESIGLISYYGTGPFFLRRDNKLVLQQNISNL